MDAAGVEAAPDAAARAIGESYQICLCYRGKRRHRSAGKKKKNKKWWLTLNYGLTTLLIA